MHGLNSTNYPIFFDQNEVTDTENQTQGLPKELIINIFSFLDTKSLMLVGATCKKLKRFSQDKELWKKLSISDLFSKKDKQITKKEKRPPNMIRIGTEDSIICPKKRRNLSIQEISL